MRRFKKSLCYLLSVMMMTTSISTINVIAEEKEKYPYVICASSYENGAVDIHASNLNINGNVATNGTITTTGNVSINGAKSENVNQDMIDLSEKLNTAYFSSDVEEYKDNYSIDETSINLNNKLYVDGNININGIVNMNIQMKATEDIVIKGQALNASNCVLYSTDGDVYIDSTNSGVTGLIYAPKGNVKIKTTNANFSVIIIAKTVTIDCISGNINYNENMAEVIGTDTETLEDDISYLLAGGKYNSENKKVEIEWYSNLENKTFEIYESDDNEKYEKISTVDGKENTYDYDIKEGFVKKYFKIVGIINSKKKVESVPFMVNKDKDKYIIEYIDTDGDGVIDAGEYMYETDIEKEDTDNDGLTDYQEIYITNTDPTVTNSVDTELNDSEVDIDGDGLSNIEELLLGSNPLKKDTDEDGLTDGDEKNKYDTDLLEKDTDKDGLYDGDEIVLGTNPNKYDTDGDGRRDGSEQFEQYIGEDEKTLETINTNDNAYKVNLKMKAAGNAMRIAQVNESSYSDAIKSNSQLGKSIEIKYEKEYEISKFTLNFQIKEDYIQSENENYIDGFDGIKRLQVFKYYEDINMLLPIETYYDTDNNTVSCDASGLGTYCLMDVESWLEYLGYKFENINAKNMSKSLMLSNNRVNSCGCSCEFECGPDCTCEKIYKTKYRIMLGVNWSTVELDDKLSPNNLTDTDGDGLSDWDEIDSESLLISYDNNGEPIFPTVQSIIEKGYPFVLTDRLNEFQSIKEFVYSLEFVPCITDPTKQDTDGDFDIDSVDSHPVNYQLNDLLCNQIVKLKKLADEYAEKSHQEYVEYTTSVEDWLSFMFIRQFNNNYVGGNWDGTAGCIDDRFVSFVLEKDLDLYEYFENTTEFYANEQGEVGDLYHMAATLTAYIYDSKKYSGDIRFKIIPEKHINNLAGWAGDLQTAMNNAMELSENKARYVEFKSIMKNLIGYDKKISDVIYEDGKHSFDMVDVYADTDAYNIYKMLFVGGDLEWSLLEYYDSGYLKRFSEFTNYGDEAIINSTVFTYTLYTFFFYKWPLFEEDKKINLIQSIAARDAFVEFLMERRENE